MAAKKKVKPGTSKASAAQRKILFAHAYIANGRNAKQAAITVGYAPSCAEATGSRLTRDDKVAAIIAEATQKAAKIAGLTVERTLRELARIAYSDPRKLFDKNRNLINVSDLDDDSAAAIASIEQDEQFEGSGDDRTVSGYLKKIKLWDKNSALEKAMKYHGLYEADNSQKPVVSAELDIVDTARRLAFILAKGAAA